MFEPQRILVGHLGMYGDILYGTAVARQIKQDYPDSHVTWVVADIFQDILANNPYIDEVVGYHVSSREDIIKRWFAFADDMRALQRSERYDQLFLLQPYPGYPQRLRDTIRQSIFRGYRFDIDVPITPVLRLTETEVLNVKRFVEVNNLPEKGVILFETTAGSGQSGITPAFAKGVAEDIVSAIPDTKIILSGKTPIISTNPNIVDASVLTLRENAELSKYCSLFIGGSSGVTWVCQTDWAKPLPMIQLLRKGSLGSVNADHEYHNIPTDTIIEITDMSQCAVCVLEAMIDFKSARKKYCEKITPDFTIVRFNAYLEDVLINHRPVAFAILAAMTAFIEYGFTRDSVDFARYLAKRVSHKIEVLL